MMNPSHFYESMSSSSEESIVAGNARARRARQRRSVRRDQDREAARVQKIKDSRDGQTEYFRNYRRKQHPLSDSSPPRTRTAQLTWNRVRRSSDSRTADDEDLDRLVLGYRDGNILIPDDSRWNFKRRLGQGSFGLVTLWERPRQRPGGADRMALKVSIGEADNSLDSEIKLMGDLGRHPHITNMLHEPVSHGNWLYLEYCEHGNLEKLIRDRRKLAQPFFERTLWGFFQCLVHGLAVMDHKTEDPYEPERRPPMGDANHMTKFGPCTHYDMKPSNVMISRSSLHDHTEYEDAIPILKISDFGNSGHSEWENRYYTEDQRREGRNFGTVGYFAPEQFSEEWDTISGYPSAEEWSQKSIGNWGTWTNIWGVGIIMYQLMKLEGPPSVSSELSVSHIYPDIEAPTYGHKLVMKRDGTEPYREQNDIANAVPYSQFLRQAVLRCLIKNIHQRISLRDLAEVVAQGCELIRVQNVEGEDDILQRTTLSFGGPYNWNIPSNVSEAMNGAAGLPFQAPPVYFSSSSESGQSSGRASPSPNQSPKSNQGPVPGPGTNSMNSATGLGPGTAPMSSSSSDSSRSAAGPAVLQSSSATPASNLVLPPSVQPQPPVQAQTSTPSNQSQLLSPSQYQSSNSIHPRQALLLNLFHYFDTISTDQEPQPTPDNMIRLRRIRIWNDRTFDDLKRHIAAPNTGPGSGLGLLIDTIKLARLDCGPVIEYGDELGGWTLAEGAVAYFSQIYVTGSLA